MFCRSSQAVKQQQSEKSSTLNVTAMLPPRETNLILGIASLSHLLGQKVNQSINMCMHKSFPSSLALEQASSLPCKPNSAMRHQDSDQKYSTIPFLKYPFISSRQFHIERNPSKRQKLGPCIKTPTASQLGGILSLFDHSDSTITLSAFLGLELFYEQQHQLFLMPLLFSQLGTNRIDICGIQPCSSKGFPRA